MWCWVDVDVGHIDVRCICLRCPISLDALTLHRITADQLVHHPSSLQRNVLTHALYILLNSSYLISFSLNSNSDSSFSYPLFLFNSSHFFIIRFASLKKMQWTIIWFQLFRFPKRLLFLIFMWLIVNSTRQRRLKNLIDSVRFGNSCLAVVDLLSINPSLTSEYFTIIWTWWKQKWK